MTIFKDVDNIKKLKTFAARQNISRRDFMQRASVLGMLVAAPAIWASRAKAATQGGHFRIGMGQLSTSDSLDPAVFNHSGMYALGWTFRNNLVEIDARGVAVPELAESWDASQDLKRWSFRIRSGIEFHNGKTLTPDDVIANMNYHLSEDSKSTAKNNLSEIESVSVDGSDVVFVLKSGNADFPYLLSAPQMNICPADEKSIIDWRSGVGTGPFVLKEFEPGLRIKGIRNKKYWKEGRGHFDSIEYIGIGDSSARVSALITNEVDVINQLDTRFADKVEAAPSVVYEQKTGLAHATFPMRADQAPFNDPNVRLAIKYATNRELIVRNALNGFAIPGNDQPITPAYRFYDSDLPLREFDADKAKFHLKQAGFDRLDLTLHAAEIFAGGIACAEVFAAEAKKGGINVSIQREPKDGYWSNTWMKKPFAMSFWNGRPTEDWMFTQGFSNTTKWNEGFWDHERFNELLVEARGEQDNEKRRGKYHEMQRIVRDEGASVIYAYLDQIHAFRDNVRHEEEIAGNLELDGLRCAERWWFA